MKTTRLIKYIQEYNGKHMHAPAALQKLYNYSYRLFGFFETLKLRFRGHNKLIKS